MSDLWVAWLAPGFISGNHLSTRQGCWDLWDLMVEANSGSSDMVSLGSQSSGVMSRVVCNSRLHSSLFIPPCLVQCLLYSTGDLAPYSSPVGAINLEVLRVTPIWLLPRPHLWWPSLHSCLTPMRVLLSSMASGQTLGNTWDLFMLPGITGGPGKLTQACLCLTLLNNQVELWWLTRLI